MKVIDLLNKIANGEEVPKQIKYEGKIYTYDENFQDYKMLDNYGSSWLINKIFDESEDTLYALGYELEIIKEDKEIEIFKLNEEDIHDLTLYNATENEAKLHRLCCKLANKINELVKAVNELKKGK